MIQLLNSIKKFYTFELSGWFLFTEILTKLWITILFLLFCMGFAKMVYELIINPYQFSNIEFGLIDYI